MSSPLYEPTVNEDFVKQIEVDHEGFCCRCPWLRTKMKNRWCKLTDFYEPVFSECELYQIKLFKGVKIKNGA